MRARIGTLVFDVALRSFPPEFRRRHAVDMREAFVQEVARARERGLWFGTLYTVRVVVDLLKQGWRERVRRGPLPGHGQRAPEPTRGGGMFQGMGVDVRLAFRALRRSPGFAAAAVVVLALGIGANTTVFSALKAAILAPPPYPDVDRVVMVDLTYRRSDDAQAQPMYWSYPKFEEYLRQDGRLVDPVAGYARRFATLTDAGDPALIGLELVTPGYFEILGAAPEAGRTFGPAEGDADAPRLVAILSHAMWRSRFSGDGSVVGRTLTLNGRSLEIVGVAPAGFEGLTGGAELWIPMAAAAEVFNRFMIDGAQAHWLNAVGRLRADATVEEAGAQMAALGQGVAEAFPSDDPADVYGGGLRRFTEARVNGDARSAVVLLSVAAALVLLVACANLSGLLLARARRKARDGAVRMAVGASRWRLIRSSLVESGVLAILGGGAGLVVAAGGTRALAAAWPGRFLTNGEGTLQVMDLGTLSVDPPVLGFAFVVTLATALLFGLAPALRATRIELSDQLKKGARGTVGGRGFLGLDTRALLVGVQVALALVLMVGAGLVGGSLKRLLDVDEGLDTRNLLAFSYSLPRTDAAYGQPAEFHRAFLERVASLPGVLGATLGDAPLAGHSWTTRVQDIPGQPPIPQGEGGRIGVHMVGDRHFEILGIPVLRGRSLDERDGTDRTPTVVISRYGAETLFPGEDPVGRLLKMGVGADDRDAYAEIVGVVGDVLYGRPDAEPIAEAYFSYREFGDASATVLVRSAGEPFDLLPGIRDEIKSLKPSLALYRITTLDALVADSMGDRRIVLGLLALFSAMTLLLAATGTWGVVAYAVADRRKELGLRMALGADGGRVVAMMLRQTVRTALLGLGLGIGGAWAGTRLLNAFLFETDARDPLAFAGAAALLFSVVMVASYLPARRATRVDPVEALRAE